MPAAPAPGQVDASPWPDSAELLSPGLAMGWPAVHSQVLHPGAGGGASDLAPTVAGEPQTVTGAQHHLQGVSGATQAGPEQSHPTAIFTLFSLFNSVISLSFQRNI